MLVETSEAAIAALLPHQIGWWEGVSVEEMQSAQPEVDLQVAVAQGTCWYSAQLLLETSVRMRDCNRGVGSQARSEGICRPGHRPRWRWRKTAEFEIAQVAGERQCAALREEEIEKQPEPHSSLSPLFH
mmetsp:Transcript_35339/g.75316  ORF Transcript_35339/g.75316 Transcript_35339/m.75316 type:complete len:129 (-) Transcript_35339:324-710(-)